MLRRIERLLVDIAIVSVLGLGVLITTTVILRAVFNSGVPDAIVMVSELMVAAVILPLAATTAGRAHIVVEFVSNRMPARVRDGLVVFGSIFGLLALVPLIWAGWREVVSAVEGGGYFFGDLNLPKWPGRVIFLIGVSFAWLRLLIMVWHDLGAMRRGEPLAETGHGG
jgi:TRAP-type C4-dicarboxylate transport system permease small subunit